MLCSSAAFYPFSGSPFSWAASVPPCPRRCLSTYGCFRGGPNWKREAPGGRLAGIKSNGERDGQGEERGGEQRRAYRVGGRSGLGKSRCPRELEGPTELAVARSGASREEEIPKPASQRTNIKEPFWEMFFWRWRFTCYSDSTLYNSFVVFRNLALLLNI